MYAVIRAGGKQYRVAPGDVIMIEKRLQSDDQIEFSEVLAVSAEEGKIRPSGGAKESARSSETAAQTRSWSSTTSARSSTRS